jgi:UDP-N-acetylmuramyl pentapeptide synthase
VIPKTAGNPFALNHDLVRLVEVDDTPAAHRAIAGVFRQRFTEPAIAIGAGSRKTPAKDVAATVLASRRRIAKSEGSQNGELGIPRTLEQLRPDRVALRVPFHVAVSRMGLPSKGPRAIDHRGAP